MPTPDKLGKVFPRGSSVLVVNGPMKDKRPTVRGVARDGKIQAILDGLTALGTITLLPPR